MEDEQFRAEKPRKSLRRLPESIQSLLGLKAYLTPSWVESVCHIIKDLPSARKIGGSPVKISKKMESTAWNDAENHDSISKLHGEIALLNTHLNQLNLKRRQTLNDFLDLKGNIRVFCRMRPFLDDERYYELRSIISSDLCSVLLKISETKCKKYNFDRIFHSQSTQDEVFSEIEPVIKSALDGYNVCIFAYGQTGTGKTFTMEGKQDSPGIVPRGIEALFRQALESNLEYMFTFSMLEIYMGRLRDLLVPRNRNTRGHNAPCLSIQTDPSGDVEIENLIAMKVSDFNQVERLYKLGTQLRSTASTMSNSTSSRSHCLTRISITCVGVNSRRRETSKIWMVDLGGSERLLKTQASGRRLQEGKAINLSLSALGDVISALQSKKQHVPYRNSKLTQVLRDSLGTDSKTLMLVHVSPKEEDLCETICSLGFATRVRSIHLGCEEPAELRAKREETMAELQEKLKHYESKCQNVQNDIEILKERFRHSARPESQDCRNTETSYFSTEMMQIDGMKNEHNAMDLTANSRSQPGFMRPTFASQRKMGMNYHTSGMGVKKPPLPSKRKSSSVYAESVTSSVNASDFQSDYGSECSTATISGWKKIVDDGSECSQSALECEIKKIILQDNEKPNRGSRTSLSCESRNVSVKGQTNGKDKPKHVNIENWLHLQTNKKTSTSANRTKRVLAVPVCNGAKRCNGQNSSMIHKKNMNGFRMLNSNASVEQNAAAAAVDNPVSNKAMDELPNSFESPAMQNSESKHHQKSNQNQGTAEAKHLNQHHEELAKSSEDEPPIVQIERSMCKTINSCSENLNGSPEHIEGVEKPYLHLIRSRVSLFMDTDSPEFNQENVASEDTTEAVIDQNGENPNKGTHRGLPKTIQILWTGALLGLGIQSLGYEHDFFYGLTF
ncbi:hypothetical protein J5N97_013607 [Dioscorea zingiberensis]|uniref:Kinesin motor domain-containing protein n=1 Tax=Dioscorea zingiberensis TaxID=325984 RepID=A0A9D5CRH8_9LILI|nr:hypothetical protein J5N97_013607 [Dioscorea zingiberensis]